tara:strand:+ start:3506 stop:3937 length:432 start_codon:yes stop_codon:yes gene_type:complete
MQRLSSKSISELVKKLESNFPPYDLISSYKGEDFKNSIKKTSPNDNIINVVSTDNWDVNLCILQPKTFYYSKIPSYLKVLEGCVWTELQIGADPINPGFMLDKNKSIQLVQPFILNNTGMNRQNIILSINKKISVPTKDLPLL